MYSGVASNWAKVILIFIPVILSIYLYSNVLQTFAVGSSPVGEFNVTPGTVSFNWTGGVINITLTPNVSTNVSVTGLVVNVSNSSTFISTNYSQHSRFVQGEYPNITSSTNYNTCGGSSGTPIRFLVQNQSGIFTAATLSMINGSINFTVFTLYPYLFCPPGRYYGNILVHNATNTSEAANITAIINIPISPDNTFVEVNLSAQFKGIMATNSDYHSYYFWTNQTTNITSFTINLTGISDDMDIFLFNDVSTFVDKSINTSTNPEIIPPVTLPATGAVWELRVYGNVSSSYNGFIFFSTLNVTNSTMTNTTLASLSFGQADPNQTVPREFNIRNEKGIIRNVNETSEIYYIQRFTGNTNSMFRPLVTNFTQRVNVRLQWAVGAGPNITDWDLFVRDNNGNIIGESTNKWFNANFTNSTKEEFVVFSGPFNTSNEGYWNITVLNQTNTSTVLNNYNVTIIGWVNQSQWFISNFTQGFTFNSSNLVNSSHVTTVNITVPARNLVNGTYEGFIEYRNGSGWVTRLPLSFSVKAGNLVINNSIKNATVRITDNIGFNRTNMSSPINLSVRIGFNNTGGYPIYYVNTSSENSVKLSTDSSKFINFTVTTWPANPIENGTIGAIGVFFNLTSNTTQNTAGIYTGWILFNTTNTTLNSSSYPYDTFNLSLEVNLTDRLIVNVVSVNPTVVPNSSLKTNITALVEVRLINGSVISYDPIFGLANITNMSIYHENNTNYRIGLSNISYNVSGVTTCPTSSPCGFNGTLGENTVGGRYIVAVDVRWFNGERNLTGTGANNSNTSLVVVGGTGLNLTAVTSKSISQNEGTSVVSYFNVSVINFGPTTTSGTLSMSTTSIATIVTDSVASGCGSSSSGATFNAAIDGNATELCWYRWKITSVANVSSTTSATLSITASETTFANITDISLTINNVDSSSGTDGGTDTGGTTSCTKDADCTATQYCSANVCKALSCAAGQKILDHTCVSSLTKISITGYESSIYTIFGGWNTTKVVVNNTGDTNITAKLEVNIDSEISYALSATSCTLGTKSSCSINVTLNTTNSTKVKEYTGKFKAFVSTNSSIFDEKSFTLKVLPTEEKKVEINISYLQYLGVIKDIKTEFNAIKISGVVSAGNLSVVELLLNDTDSITKRIEEALASGDYITASTLLTELNATIDRTKERLEALKAEKAAGEQRYFGDIWFWIVVGVIAGIVIILLVYMLLPAPGYHPKYGYTPQKKGLAGKVKNMFSRGPKPEKLQQVQVKLPEPQQPPQEARPAYAGDYQKVAPAGYQYDKEKKK